MFTKLFNGYMGERNVHGYRKYEGVDVQINKFLDENPFYELVDVKLTVKPDGDFNELIALAIFK